MKKIEVHPFSAALGATALALVAAVSGAQSLHHPTRGVVTIAGIPTPQQMMRVVQSAPFTVPTGKLFVATGFAESTSSANTDISVRVNGQILFWHRLGTQQLVDVPTGFTVSAGNVVHAQSNNGGSIGVLFGYLVDA